jgi:hypothetical protein
MMDLPRMKKALAVLAGTAVASGCFDTLRLNDAPGCPGSHGRGLSFLLIIRGHWRFFMKELLPPLPGKLTPLHPVHFNHQGA